MITMLSMSLSMSILSAVRTQIETELSSSSPSNILSIIYILNILINSVQIKYIPFILHQIKINVSQQQIMAESVSYIPNTTLPLNKSDLFQRPYLVKRNKSKKQKPNFSKLSILTKTSICSAKNNTRLNNHKTVQRKNKRKNESQVQSNKRKNDSHHQFKSVVARTTKIQPFDYSENNNYLLDFFKRNSPLNRTGKKRRQCKSIEPLYFSAIFNKSAEEGEGKGDLNSLVERAALVLRQYREKYEEMRRERDSLHKKYEKMLLKMKKSKHRS